MKLTPAFYFVIACIKESDGAIITWISLTAIVFDAFLNSSVSKINYVL